MIGALGAGLIMGGVGSALSVVDIIRGNRMRKEAEKNLRNLKGAIPEAQMRQVGLAQTMATQGMPGYEMTLNNLGLQNSRAFGQAAQASTTSQDLLSAVTQGLESSQDQSAQLGLSNAEYQRAGMLNLQSQLGGLAQSQQNVYNRKYETYANNLMQGRDLTGQGMQGIGGSIGGAMPFIAAGTGDQSWDRFASMFGRGPVTR
jgi:hypothetical protein